MGWHSLFGSCWRNGEPLFRVWAPNAKTVELVLEPAGGAAWRFPMEKGTDGFFSVHTTAARIGDLYRFQLDDTPAWPDPASRYQPQGVHGASQLLDPATFSWSDHLWTGVAPERLVLYELHVGAFTAEGTFAAATAKLSSLADLGVTAVELMPVADFPGSRNWGYDGVASLCARPLLRDSRRLAAPGEYRA